MTVLSSCLCFLDRLVSSKESQLCEATILIPLVEIVDGSPSDSLVSIILLKLSAGDGFARKLISLNFNCSKELYIVH